MLKRLLTFAVIVITIAAAGTAHAKTSYTKKLYTTLWESASLVIDGIIADTKESDGELLCRVELQGAYKADGFPHLLIPLELNVYLPADAAKGDPVILFLKNDPADGLVKAIRGEGGEPFVYKPEDYAFIKSRLPKDYAKDYSRQRIAVIARQAETMELTDDIEALFANIPASYGGLFYDLEDGSLVVALTKKADEAKIRREVSRVTQNNPHVRVIVEDRPSLAKLNALIGEITGKYQALTPEQRKKINLPMYGLDTQKGRIVVSVTCLDDGTAALFKEWISDSPWIELEWTDMEGVPQT